MKKIDYFFGVLFLGFCFFIVSNSSVQAATADFGVKANYNDHQTAENGIIDVYGDAGSSQNISFSILNKDDKRHKYNVYVHTAYTDSNGQLDYSKNIANDPTLNLKINRYVQPQKQTVYVDGGEIKTVSLRLNIPSNNFKGFLMGGIVVKLVKSAKESSSVTSNGTVLRNNYQQGLPIRLRHVKDEKKDPNFRVRYVFAFADKTMKTRGVKANLQNYVKGYNADINVKATVTRRPDDHKFKKIAKQTHISPAPNSNYNYQIDWGKTPLQAGDYHLHMKLTTNDKTRSWIVDKNFSISNEDAAKYNKLSGIKPNYMWLWILIAILVLLLVLGLGVYFGRRNQQKNQPPMNNYNQR